MSRKYLIPALLALSSVGAYAEGSNKFVDVDADNDGAVTQAELDAAGLNSSVVTADANADGSLSLTEYEASMKAHSTSESLGGAAKSDSSVGVDAYSD